VSRVRDFHIKARAKADGRALDISGASSARQALALSALEGTHAMLQTPISTVMTLDNDYSAWRRPHPGEKTRCHLLPSARLPWQRRYFAAGGPRTATPTRSANWRR